MLFITNNIISFFSSRNERSYLHLHVFIFGENKRFMLQALRGKQNYQVTNVDVEKIKLSCLLV